MSQDLDIFGFGESGANLSSADIFSIVESALENIAENSRVLAIIPDKTRDDTTHQLFPFAAEILAKKSVKKFDALIAQGTHAPMNDAEKLAKIGVKSLDELPVLGEIFDHEWDNPNELIEIGKLSAEKVSEITDRLIDFAVSLTVNKRLSSAFYDYILIFGATVPHEVAGFAGGAKYFFPGVSGADLTNATHWLGALAGIENVIGKVETPTRHLIETAADFIQPKIINFTSVLTRNAANELQTHALFAGDFRGSFRKAAEVSAKVHIKYAGRKYKKVVAVLDEHYDELWTGGKASYKLGGIIEDGGELIIFAPHLRGVSDTHGATIEKYGYAPIEKVKKVVAEAAELGENLCVAAHLAHVAYGASASDPFAPRYKITLASQITDETCRKLNLHFLKHQDFKIEDWQNEPDCLIVERAGRDLYLVD